MIPRIALMADSTESLEPLFLPKKGRTHLFPLVLNNSGIQQCVKKNFEPEHIIPINLNKKGSRLFSFEELPKNSNASQKMKIAGITHLLAPYPCSEKFQKWVNKHMITLLTTPPALQKKLEDKHFFDRLLKGRNIASPKTFTPHELRKKGGDHHNLVVQRRQKDGSYVTTITSWGKIKDQKRIKNSKNVLAREYIDGLPLGVSIFLDRQGNFFYSALRRQCFAFHKGAPNLNAFVGIQWMPTSFFPDQSLRSISRTLKKVAQTLINSHYVGVANIDFILSKEKAYVLECNPRLSSATPQVFSVQRITSSSNPWRFFLNALLGAPNKKLRQSLLPPSSFSGATLDLEMKNMKKARFHKPGIYTFTNNRITFVSDDMNLFSRGSHFFAMIHEAPYPGFAKAKTIPCSIISNAPLYHFNTGALNEQGGAISRFVSDAYDH